MELKSGIRAGRRRGRAKQAQVVVTLTGRPLPLVLVCAGGQLFLYDKRTCRYFRRDGHSWRKKRDGKTIGETHEKLKGEVVQLWGDTPVPRLHAAARRSQDCA